MRWFWIDRFTEFISGERATAIKNVSRAEPQLTHYLPGLPMHPSSLVVEGIAQTAGLLVAQTSDFKERVVLAKLSKAVFERCALPGEQLRYECIAERIDADGANCHGKAFIGEEQIAEIDMVFAHLDERFQDGSLFEPEDFLQLLKVMDMFKVGVHPDGTPIKIPDDLV